MIQFIKHNLYKFAFVVFSLLLFTLLISCNEGESKKLTFTANYLEITEKTPIPLEVENIDITKVEFVFSDENIVCVVDGMFVPISAGTTIVTASFEDLRASLDVAVLPTMKTEFTVNETIDLNENYDYSISDESILKIVDGKLKALSTGEVSVTIKLKSDSNLFNTVKVVVTPEVPRSSYKEQYINCSKEVYVGLENFDNDDYKWEINDDTLAELYDDYYLSAKKVGTVVITITSKSNPNEKYTFTFEIIPLAPSFKISDEKFLIGEEADIVFNNDYSLENVNVSISDSTIVKLENGKLKAISEGKASITISHKDYFAANSTIEVVVFPLEPVVKLATDKITVGNSLKVNVENYDTGYDVEVDDEQILKYENGLLYALKEGVTKITVSISDDIYSEVEVEVVPLMPKVSLTYSVITVGSETGFVIYNLSELEFTSITDYLATSNDAQVATVSVKDNVAVIKGLKAGTCDITIYAKEKQNIQVNVTLTVISKNDVTTLYANIDSITSIIKTGDIFYIKVKGSDKVSDYQFVSSDIGVATVNESGRLVTTSQGIVVISVILKSDKSIKVSLTFSIEGIPNINYIDRIISMAEEEIGYREGSNNDTKYGTWYGLPNEAWCAMFVSWCAYQAGISTNIIPKYASCRIGREWFESRGQFGYKGEYTPKPGDIIFFLSAGASHTGLVIACEGNTVYTIEGNTSNMVAKRYYSLDKNTITGYGIPNYPKYDGTVSGGGTGGATDGGGASTT